MANYSGGSVSAMVRQIAEGFTLVTAVSLKRYADSELQALLQEIDKKTRDIRSETIVDREDSQAIQLQQRSLSRLRTSRQVINTLAMTRKRRG